jgi:nicotinate phosphoribosyltransferase
MAHSWVQLFDTELDAFCAYARAYPDSCTLLVDTYDVRKSGIPNAIEAFNREVLPRGFRPKGIRIDSGDITYLSKKARKMLDEAGFPDTIICASGDLDEKLVQSLKLQGAKINSWGIGTKLITSADMPALGGVYKLAGVEGEDGTIIPKIKVSDNSAKITNPGYKKIVRIYDKASGKAEADLIMLKDEVIDVTKPLTITHPLETWKKTTFTNYEIRELSVKIVEKGKLIYKMPTLKEIAKYSKTEMESFWDEYLRIDAPHIFKVDLSDKLLTLKTDMLEKIRKGNSANGK